MESKGTVSTEAERAIARLEAAASGSQSQRKPYVPTCPKGMDERDWINTSADYIAASIDLRAYGAVKAYGSVDLRMFGPEMKAKRESLCFCCGSTISEGQSAHWAQLHPAINETPFGGRYWVSLRATCYANQATDMLDENRARALALLDSPVPVNVRDEGAQASKEAEAIATIVQHFEKKEAEALGVTVTYEEEKPKRRRTRKS